MDTQELAPRQRIVESKVFRQEADARSRAPVADGRPEHRGAATRRWHEPEEHLDRGGLAGTVRAEEAEHFAASDVERQIRDGEIRAEMLTQLARLDRRSRHLVFDSLHRLGHREQFFLPHVANEHEHRATG